ncbi:MFS transporter [Herbiconiux daphne]|uniref:MFS transporter n=1 Tax=Herbiconiux daphne TaxID=2970914 RepID=A0ABT2GXU3_9MICO|nr:MFS transporter [Herbiconiux daphne]MCS5732785.1 MFS transporter [Herbiconiux daphne]
MEATAATPSGFLAPFRVGAFRALWLAGIVSNIGAWMQTVGAQWLLVEAHSPAWVIALVQTAAAAPVLLLAIPAGVLGEFLNKRLLLIVVQTGQLIVVGLLTALTVAGLTTAPVLLGLTLLLGAGSALQLPAYQAIVPEIVPVRDIPSAASLSSTGVNIARAIGPAVAGVVVAQFGVAAVFLLNALSFAAFVATLLLWRSYRPRRSRPETFIDATLAGLRYVRHSVIIRSMYLRLGLFLIPASGIWSLLPVVASTSLGLGSAGYGVLLAALGGGSILGALLLPAASARLKQNTVILISAAVFGAGSIALPWAPNEWIAAAVLVPVGVAWLGVIATINGGVQSFLPAWVRTRGLSLYQLVLYGCTALGSLLVGAAADAAGLATTLVTAGILIVAVAVSLIIRPFADPTGMGRAAVPLPLTDAPPVRAEYDVDEDQVLVLVRYTVPEADRERFTRQMEPVEESRRRTGARRWELYTDRDDPAVLVEAFVVGSWQEHLDQHADRITQYDDELLEAAKAFSTTPPSVQHLLAAPHKTRYLFANRRRAIRKQPHHREAGDP